MSSKDTDISARCAGIGAQLSSFSFLFGVFLVSVCCLSECKHTKSKIVSCRSTGTGMTNCQIIRRAVE